MGAAPSIITVPSSSISRDIEALKALSPSRFQLEKSPSSEEGLDSETMAVLIDKSGLLTVVLVAVPIAASNRIAANRVTFVLQEADMRSVVNRCENLRILTSKTVQPPEPNNKMDFNGFENVTMAEFNLPGGAGVALVAPSEILTSSSRYELGKKLADSLTRSLPKGIGRSTSNRDLVIGAHHSSAERRESIGSGRASPSFDSNGRVGSPTKKGSNKPGPVPGTPRRLPGRGTSSSFQKIQDAKNKEIVSIPTFPTLKFNSLHLNGKYKQDFFANTRVPIPVETELFVGQMVFLIRRDADPTDNEDTFWNERMLFANKKRRLVMQLQGKFKYEPKGLLYAGFEASNELRPGRVSKSLLGMMLNWAEEKNKNLYYTFGDEKERAKAVVPAHTFFDNVVVTHQTKRPPPSIVEPLKEDSISIKARSQCVQKPWTDESMPTPATKDDENYWEWNINDTYSMSWCTSNIDLPTWSLLNFPGHGDLGLRALIGNSVLRFVMYENLTPEDKGTSHLTSYLRYAYAIQCKYLGPTPTGNESNANEANDTILDWIKQQPTQQKQEQFAKHGTDIDETSSAQKEGGELMELKQSESDKFPGVEQAEMVPLGIMYPDEGQETDDSSKADARPLYSTVAVDTLSVIDTLCPAWLEMCASQGKYTRAYAFNVNNRTVFRTPQSFRDLIRVGKFLASEITGSEMDEICSPRIAKAERTRRLFGKMLERSLTGKNAESLTRMMELYSSKFLSRRLNSFPEKSTAPTKPEKSTSPVETGGLVARALSDRHWIEEWVQVTKTEINFQHPESRKCHFEIKVNNIRAIRRLRKEEAPLFYGYYFIAVDTLGQTNYIMFATEADQSRCLEEITKVCTEAAKNRIKTKSRHLCLNSSQDELARKSSIWNCGERLIMNARQMSFRTPPELYDPMFAVEDALRKALEANIEHDDEKFQSFLDSASRLKLVNANVLREEHRLSFFLNLYHVMVVHASLIVGVNDSQPSLVKSFNCLSYQCSDDIFSISEVEHRILRASMTSLEPEVTSTNPKKPPAINSRLLRQTQPFRTIPPLTFKFPTPKSSFCFALQKPDFRINFAINFGSPSNPAEIPIYGAETVWEQLEEASRLYLQGSVGIKQRNKQFVCVLPRICQWYAADFGTTNYSVLKTLQRYLNHPERKIISSNDFTSFPITIKYLPFNFECRKLELREEPFTTTVSSFTGDSQSETSSVASCNESTASTDSAASTTATGRPLYLTEAPSATETDNDVESLLDFLMDDALELSGP